MNARKMLKALALVVAVIAPMMGGCTQRTIIEEPVQEEGQSKDPRLTAIANDEGAGGDLANQALYVRSGSADPGEQESGPFPQPWTQRLGPFPQPWHREGDDSDDGKTPPPSDPNPNPNPDPNPKP